MRKGLFVQPLAILNSSKEFFIEENGKMDYRILYLDAWTLVCICAGNTEKAHTSMSTPGNRKVIDMFPPTWNHIKTTMLELKHQ